MRCSHLFFKFHQRGLINLGVILASNFSRNCRRLPADVTEDCYRFFRAHDLNKLECFFKVFRNALPFLHAFVSDHDLGRIVILILFLLHPI